MGMNYLTATRTVTSVFVVIFLLTFNIHHYHDHNPVPFRELEEAYAAAQADPAFHEEVAWYRREFIGGPTPMYHAKRLTEEMGGAQVRRWRHVFLVGGGEGGGGGTFAVVVRLLGLLEFCFAVCLCSR